MPENEKFTINIGIADKAKDLWSASVEIDGQVIRTKITGSLDFVAQMAGEAIKKYRKGITHPGDVVTMPSKQLDITQEDIERMKRDGYLGAGWTR